MLNYAISKSCGFWMNNIFLSLFLSTVYSLDQNTSKKCTTMHRIRTLTIHRIFTFPMKNERVREKRIINSHMSLHPPPPTILLPSNILLPYHPPPLPSSSFTIPYPYHPPGLKQNLIPCKNHDLIPNTYTADIVSIATVDDDNEDTDVGVGGDDGSRLW